MAKKIDTKITQAEVAPNGETPPVADDGMNESVERPENLLGSTYKIKPPTEEHAMYITVNDIVLNPGTANEVRRPFEVFVNSKNMENFQWVVALTRVISAIFRKGGDLDFLGEELKSVFDPSGGYYKPKSGGLYMPSLVAEIGYTIDTHIKELGLIEHPTLDEHQKKFIEEKKAQLLEQQKKSTPSPD